MRPIPLAANQPQRFYRGGEAIARFRGAATADDHVPEDWIGSTTAILGSAPLGLTTLPDGGLLRDAVAAEPERFLGPEHVASFGPDPALLVKLLDAGERLPVHLHPDRAFARAHLGSRYGKSEAWLVLLGGTIHLGFRDHVGADTLRGWFETQDAASMLAASNELHVSPGDCVYVPAGTPHAIGEGVFMVEVQEPSDLGVMLEWHGFVAPESATMGLDLETALGATRRRAVSRAEIASWTRRSADAPELRPGARAVVPPEASQFFRAEWLRPAPTAALEPAFAVLVAVSGSGRLTTDAGELDLARGDTVLVPYAAGAGEVTGAIEAIRCLPPPPPEGRATP
jgi:mannose-6-phosphate isomerase